jgi:hypothetical protein
MIDVKAHKPINHSLRFFLAAAALFLTSCVSANLAKVDSDSNFDWNSLKRDQILMTPLLDLRGDVKFPEGREDTVTPFSKEQNLAYPEKFKQVFFKRRKDIRVFGAGGAFEKISTIENLDAIAERVLKKEPLEPSDVKRIRDSNQDIRFLFFFVFAGESVRYGYQYNMPLKKHYVEKIYTATRVMTIKLALWDAKEERTVWIGEKVASPSNLNIIRLKRPDWGFKKIPKKDRDIPLSMPDAFDFVNPASFEYEMAQHKTRFPEFPARETSFSSTFDDFALSLPLNPSEANLIEYENFTNHRLELGLSGSELGKVPVARFHFNFSSMIYNFYRLGFDFYTDLNSPRFLYNKKYYDISSFGIGMSTDLQWELSDHTRLLTGATFGALGYRIRDVEAARQAQSNANQDPDAEEDEETSTTKPTYDESDGSFFVRPRIHILRGPKHGVQWGFGPYYIYAQEPKHALLQKRTPVKWGFELTLSFTSRGF